MMTGDEYYFEGSAKLVVGELVSPIEYVRLSGLREDWSATFSAGPELSDTLKEMIGGRVRLVTSEGISGKADATAEYKDRQWTVYLKGVAALYIHTGGI